MTSPLPQSPDDLSGFEKALQSWEEINLPELQKALDNEALEIKENQKSLLISRKELASKTKLFKKLEDNEKLSEIKLLLKSYQNEIDNLTKKSKFVETSFFKVYKEISEAPDPKPLLSNSLKSFKASSETSALKHEIAQLQEKLQRYSDYETIKSKLIDGEQKHAESLKIKLLLKDDEYKSKMDDAENKHKAAELNYERKIAQLNRQVAELKAMNEISKNKLKSQRKILGDDEDDDDDDGDGEDGDAEDENKKLTESLDDLPAGKSADSKNEHNSKSALKVELDLVNRDLQHSKSKTIELEKRNKELKATLEKLQASRNVDDALAKINTKVQTLERNNSILLQKANTDQRTINKLTNETQNQIKRLENDVADYKEKVSNLKQKLVEYQDYEDIKNELAILRSIEFDTELDNDQGNVSSNIDHGLMARNRKLNNDLVEHRNKNTALEDKVKQLSDHLKKVEFEYSKLKAANEKLEADISTVKGGSSNDNWDSMSMISGVSRFPTRSVAPSGRFPNTNSGRISPAASIAGFDDNASMIGGSGSSSTTDNSLLPIITQQRDRFRAKNIEIETRLRDSTKKLNDLKKQNTILENKVTSITTELKFLQSKSAGSATKAKPVIQNPYGDQFSSTTYDVLLDDYETFSYLSNSRSLKFVERYIGSSNAKKVDKKLNEIERYFYTFLKLILSNQTTRIIFIAYWFMLHSFFFLIFMKSILGGSAASGVFSSAGAPSGVGAVGSVSDSGKLVAGDNAAAAAAALSNIGAAAAGGAPQAAADAIKVD